MAPLTTKRIVLGDIGHTVGRPQGASAPAADRLADEQGRRAVQPEWTEAVSPDSTEAVLVSMPPGEPNAALEALLPLITSVTGQTARRHLLSREEREDFFSYVCMKLLENDGRRIKEFRGESSFRTYLVVVIKRLYADLSVREHGKWRPSAAARRGGEVFEKIEKLLYRDGYTATEAHEYLTISLGLDLSRGQFDEIVSKLPAHSLRKFEGDDGLDDLPDERFRPDAGLQACDVENRAAHVRVAWQQFLQSLSGEDRLIWALYFDDVKPSLIAQALRCPVRHVYARVDRVKQLARKHLANAGVTSGFLGAGRGSA